MEQIQTRVLTASVLSTLAELAAQPGPPEACVYWCEETDAPYEFVPTDATTVDGVTSIAPTGGTAGRWLLKSDRISIAPLGGGQDDWPRLNTIMAACAYKAKIFLRESPNWTCGTPGVPTSGTYLETGPGTIITSTLASGTFTHFVFGRFFNVINAGTLAGSPVVGNNQFLSSVSYAVGKQIIVKSVAVNTFLCSRYTVIAVAPSGPNFLITVERAILFPFTNGDNIAEINIDVRDITLIGNGATIKPGNGVDGGDRCFELEAVYNGHIKHWEIAPNAAGTGFVDAASLDIGSLWSTIEDVHVQKSTTSNGVMLESAERCGLIRDGGDGIGDGTTLFDCVNCFVQDGHGSECGSANIRLDSDGVTNVGCKDTLITGGVFSKSGNDGILINRAQRTTLVGVRFNDNASIGALVTLSDLTTFVKCTTKSNATFDVQIGSSCTGTKFVEYENQGGAVALQIDGSDVDVEGMVCTGAVTGQCIRADGGALTARNLRLTATNSSNLIYLTAGVHKITDSTWVGTSSGLNCAGATVTLTGCSGSGAGIGVYNSAGTIVFAAGNDFSGFTTPVRNDNGSASISHDTELRFSAEPIVPVAATYFMSLNGALSLNEADVEVVIKKKTTFRDIDVLASIAPGLAFTCVFTFRKAGDTALVVNLTGAAVRATKDVTPNATCINCVPGDKVCIKLEVPNGSVMANPRATAVGVAA